MPGACYGELSVMVPQPVWVNLFRMLTFFPWSLTTFFSFFACLFSCLSVRPPQLCGSSLVSVENDRSGFNARAIWGHVYR